MPQATHHCPLTFHFPLLKENRPAKHPKKNFVMLLSSKKPTKQQSRTFLAKLFYFTKIREKFIHQKNDRNRFSFHILHFRFLVSFKCWEILQLPKSFKIPNRKYRESQTKIPEKLHQIQFFLNKGIKMSSNIFASIKIKRNVEKHKNHKNR